MGIIQFSYFSSCQWLGTSWDSSMRYYQWSKGRGSHSLPGPITVIIFHIPLPLPSVSGLLPSCEGVSRKESMGRVQWKLTWFLERQLTVSVQLLCVFVRGRVILVYSQVQVSIHPLPFPYVIWKACVVLVRWRDYVTWIWVFNVHYHIYYHIKTRCLKFGLEIL